MKENPDRPTPNTPEDDPRKESVEELKSLFAEVEKILEVEGREGAKLRLHEIYTKLGAAKVLLRPAPQGSGVIAGGAVRAVVEAAGIRDISSKVLGTKNQASNVYATLEALKNL